MTYSSFSVDFSKEFIQLRQCEKRTALALAEDHEINAADPGKKNLNFLPLNIKSLKLLNIPGNQGTLQAMKAKRKKARSLNLNLQTARAGETQGLRAPNLEATLTLLIELGRIRTTDETQQETIPPD